MRMTVVLENILGIIRQSKIARKLFGPLFHLFHHDTTRSVVDGLKKNFQEKGLRVLSLFDSMMTRNGFRYSLAFGTMLGAVREKGFIKHDVDIDVLMWIEDFKPSLLDCFTEYGFLISHSYSVDNDKSAKEITVLCDGVQIDVFFIYPPLEGRVNPYCCDFVVHPDCLSRDHSLRKYGGLLPRRIEIPMSPDVIRVPFETLSLPILTNAREFLRCRYGDDFMTPNPMWVNAKNAYIIPWTEKVAQFT